MLDDDIQGAVNHAEAGFRELEASARASLTRTEHLNETAGPLITQAHDQGMAAIEAQRHLTESVVQDEVHTRGAIQSNTTHLQAVIACCLRIEQEVRAQTTAGGATIAQTTVMLKNVHHLLEEESVKAQKLFADLSAAVGQLQSEQGQRQVKITQHLSHMTTFAQTASDRWGGTADTLMARWDDVEGRLHTSITDLDHLSEQLGTRLAQKNETLTTTLRQHTDTGLHALETVLVNATKTSLLAHSNVLTQEIASLEQAGTHQGQEVQDGLGHLTSTLEGVFPFLSTIQELTSWMGNFA